MLADVRFAACFASCHSMLASYRWGHGLLVEVSFRRITEGTSFVVARNDTSVTQYPVLWDTVNMRPKERSRPHVNGLQGVLIRVSLFH